MSNILNVDVNNINSILSEKEKNNYSPVASSKYTTNSSLYTDSSNNINNNNNSNQTPRISVSILSNASSNINIDDKQQEIPNIKFAEVFAGNINTTYNQIDTGKYYTKRMGQMLNKISELELEHSKNILKIVDHEATKQATHGIDGCPNAWLAYLQTHMAMRNLANVHAVLARFLTEQLSGPIAKFVEESDVKCAEIFKNNQKGEALVNDSVVNAGEALMLCEKNILAAKQLVDCDSEPEARARANTIKEKEKDSSLSLFSIKNMMVDAFTAVKSTTQSKSVQRAEALETAKRSSEHYKSQVVASNKLFKSFYKTDLPKFQNELQKIEENRLNLISNSLKSLAVIFETITPKYQEMIRVFNASSEAFNPKQELVTFIRNNQEKYSVCPPFLTLSLDPELSDVLTKIANDTYITQNKKKNESISSPVSLEKEPHDFPKSMPTSPLVSPSVDSPSLPLNNKLTYYANNFDPDGVPEVIKAFGTSLRPFLTTEGIFRLSPSGTDLEKLREKVISKNYDASNFDCHVPSSIMKEILRADPLISPELYNSCIEFAKTFGRPAEEPIPDKEPLLPQLEDILDKMTPIYRNTLFYICGLIHEASQPHNSSQSKMTLPSLAIVCMIFYLIILYLVSQCFLRNPSDEPLSMLANTKHECSFLVNLVKRLNAANLLTY